VLSHAAVLFDTLFNFKRTPVLQMYWLGLSYTAEFRTVYNDLEKKIRFLQARCHISIWLDAMRTKTCCLIYKQSPILRHVTERIGEVSLKVNEATTKILHKNMWLCLLHGKLNLIRRLIEKHLIHFSILGLSRIFFFLFSM
jgi:hypothetical protein